MHTTSILTLATTLLSTTLTLAAPTYSSSDINAPALSKRQTTSNATTPSTTTTMTTSFTFKLKPWATYQQCGVKKEFFSSGAIDFVSGKCQDIPASQGFQIRPTTPNFPPSGSPPLYVYSTPCGSALTSASVSTIEYDGTDGDQKCYVSSGPRAVVPWFGGVAGAVAKSVCWGVGCPVAGSVPRRRGS